MRIAEFFQTLGVIFLGILVGICLVIINQSNFVFGQCYGPDCPQMQQGCPGGMCPTPSYSGVRVDQSKLDAVDLNAVLRVRAMKNRSESDRGSGAVVQWGPVKVFLTAWHVVRDAPGNVSVNLGDQWIPIQYIYADPTFDFAVYTAPSDVKPLSLVVLDNLRPGTAMLGCGYGGDMRKWKFPVLYRQNKRPNAQDAADWMELDGAAIGGDSGGPIISMQGDVIGVLWGSNQEGNVTIATHSRRIAAALDAIIKKYTPCSYDPSGLFRPCPPRTVQRQPGTPGARTPVPESRPEIFVAPITPPSPIGPSFPEPVPVSEPVTVNVQDNSVVAAWVGDLNTKVDRYTENFDSRIGAVEQAAGVAITEAAVVLDKAKERINSIETRTMLVEDEMKRLPERIVQTADSISQMKMDTLGKQLRNESDTAVQKVREESGLMGQGIRNDFVTALQIDKEQRPAEIRAISNGEIQNWIPTLGLGGAFLAAVVCIVILLARRKIDAWDGNPDGYVDVNAIRENRRRRWNVTSEIDEINKKLDAIATQQTAG